jgi:hypothetical protein
LGSSNRLRRSPCPVVVFRPLRVRYHATSSIKEKRLTPAQGRVASTADACACPASDARRRLCFLPLLSKIQANSKP